MRDIMDLHSNTVTKPAPKTRWAGAEAAVGDDGHCEFRRWRRIQRGLV